MVSILEEKDKVKKIINAISFIIKQKEKKWTKSGINGIDI